MSVYGKRMQLLLAPEEARRRGWLRGKGSTPGPLGARGVQVRMLNPALRAPAGAPCTVAAAAVPLFRMRSRNTGWQPVPLPMRHQ